ncbi:MetQ/NlpA family ABC transporter substrate-binding protein [Treponema zioleckii]|uniref:MetQ/NlpA family ABC transporter substrate-binding protein n=1 Tax=Treponema zioleckii TaxID=331680 RepID=UPI00168B796B|nr:MetQ/NlpA family ABC transporter substrate-binding protein [Treponema zioleckii]
MKKILSLAVFAALSVSAVFAQTTLKVGATPEPHASILNLVKDDLKEQGIDLQVVEFTDYVTPNEAVEAGDIDANYFQHIPYLNSFNKEKGTHLVNAAGIHVEPFAVYSSKIKNIKDLKKKAVIAIPNDPTNEGRALLLLQQAGLITLKPNAGITATPIDIKKNPLKLKFKEIEAATLPRILQDVDAAVINGNYAIPAGLSAAKDGLVVEGSSSPYVNVVAVKKGHENDAAIKALVNALKSQKVKDWVKAKYPNGEVVTVF